MASVSLKRAWVTLMTHISNLPGVITLAYTLHKYFTACPLVILIIPSLLEEYLGAVDLESK